MKLRALPTDLDGVSIVETEQLQDNRGSFARLYCLNELSQLIGNRQIVQINRSQTCSVGAIRGMHFQKPPCAEMKLIRCLKGRVFDVAIDLRADSPTFLKWHGEILSEENRKMIVISEGFAHGFQVLEPSSELLYLHTSFYEPASEGAIRFDDPEIGISWPLEPTDLSQRDLNHPLLTKEFKGVRI